MSEEVENRWATPSITNMEWHDEDRPAWFMERKVQDALEDADGNPVLISGNPARHIIRDAEGTTSFWRCSVFIVFTSGPDVNTGIRMTSIAMHEDGDTETSMQRDYAEQVIRHLRSTAGVQVQRV
jgi:hypothetical protein